MDWIKSGIKVNENHEFVIRKPSVSKITNILYPFDKEAIPEAYLLMAQNKGTCVHYQMENYIVNGKIIGCICDKKVDSHQKCFLILKAWYDENIPAESEDIKIYAELPLANDEFIGIPDLFVVNNKKNEIEIIDWKTTKEMNGEKYKVSLYLYYLLVNDNLISQYTFWRYKMKIVNAYPNRKKAKVIEWSESDYTPEFTKEVDKAIKQAIWSYGIEEYIK